MSIEYEAPSGNPSMLLPIGLSGSGVLIIVFWTLFCGFEALNHWIYVESYAGPESNIVMRDENEVWLAHAWCYAALASFPIAAVLLVAAIAITRRRLRIAGLSEH